jgi:hypothetical protein
MRASAYGKIEKNTYVLPASSARRTSREALTYAATHPGTCNKDARGKLRFLRILDDRLEKNIDNNENAIVVAFLEKVKSSLHTFATENKHKTTSITAIFQKIQLLDASANVPTALKTIETALKAETQLTERAIELESRVNQTIHVYMQIFPNLFRQRIWRLPTRSRAFIEIEQYSRLYNVMKEFAERKSFSSGLSDVLLSLTRMDNLYEYYCLAKLLQTMDVQGWALSKAACCAYKVHDRKPRPDGIADKYIFNRGESTATLYYEPVMYGTEREEEGIDLHRLHLTDNGNNAYLTPDFYLRITDAEGERRYIFDAKLRRFDENATKTANDALIKYKLGLASGSNDRVDGLWLFMGRDAGADLFPINNTTFARKRPALMTDGLAQLSPEGSALPKLAQLIGIANLDLSPVIKARHLSESAAGEDANASTRVASTNTGTLTTTNANLSVNPAKTETQLQPETKPTNISDAPSKNKPPAPKKVAAPAPSSTFEVPADVLESIKALLETAKTQGLLETKDFANTISAREPLLRKKPPQGRGKQRYSASPIEICGEEYYVYTHWPPNLIKKLKDKAEEYELKHKETEPQDDN